MSEKENKESTNPFAYMEELSKAYREAFLKRLAKAQNPLSEEKCAALCSFQQEIAGLAEAAASTFDDLQKKELAAMAKESAEECLRLLGKKEEKRTTEQKAGTVSNLLSRAVLLANRSLNLVVRHAEFDDKTAFLILSELSALYAIAAIN